MFNLRLIAYLAVAAGLFFGGWTVNGWRWSSKYEALVADHQTKVAQAESAARTKEKEFRDKERQWQGKIDDAYKTLQEAKKRNTNVAAGFKRELDGLRKSIANFAASAGGTEATLETCRRDAGTLGEVLGETLQREERLTEEIESTADTARALYEGWPK